MAPKASSKSNLMPLQEELIIEESHSFKKNVSGTHILLGIRDTNALMELTHKHAVMC